MDMNRPADEPDGTVAPAGAPSTNMLVTLMPLTMVCAPEDAEWNCSVGASSPASHPATAGISRARTPAPSSRRPAAVFPELARITANASSYKGAGGGIHSRHGHVAWRSTTGRRNAIGPGNDRY